MQAIEDRYKVHCGLQQLFTQHAGCAVPALPQGGGYDFTLLAQKEKAAPRRCTGLTAQLAAFLAGQTTRLETTYAADTAACTARAEVTAYGSTVQLHLHGADLRSPGRRSCPTQGSGSRSANLFCSFNQSHRRQ